MSTSFVDDSRLNYTGTWQTQDCTSDCVTKLSLDQIARNISEQSWHTATGPDLATASYAFTGTGVTVIGFNLNGGPQYVDFLLDGSPAGNYSNSTAPDTFNIPLISFTNLPSTEHTLEMRVPQPDVAGISIDSLTISLPPTVQASAAPLQTADAPPVARTSPSAAVLAGILAPAILILIALAAFLVARRSRLARTPRPTPAPYPFALDAEANSAPPRSGVATPRFINPPGAGGGAASSESGLTGSGTLELTAPSFVRSPVSEMAPHSFAAPPQTAAHLMPSPLVVQNDV